MKKLLITALKILLSVGILGYLVWSAVSDKKNGNVFEQLWSQPKNWGDLAIAWAACGFAVMLTFVRWWYLVRALGIPCRFRDALRISFWGYLFNLAPLGVVGGDLVKAYMLDHEHRGYRAKAVASVLFDRVIGLYILFVVAAVAILLTGFWRMPDPFTAWISKLTFIITGAFTVGLFVVMGPDMSDGKILRALGRIPKVGPPLESLFTAMRMYSSKPVVLIVSSLLTIGVHCTFAIGCYLIACGLPGNHLSLSDHFVVFPLSAATGVIPLAFGPFEGLLDIFYARVSAAEGLGIAKGQGLIVALAYRLITVLIAACGIFYYLRNRQEMAQVMHETQPEAVQ